MPEPAPNRLASRETYVVIAVTIAGALLRLWGLGSLGLTHFDEGIYAASGAWSLDVRGLAALDPEVIAYAPPAYPVLVGLAYSVIGVSDLAPLLVSIACGIATIPVAAWVGRRTFGTGAGAATAAFAALALAHIAFSRKALTDAPFLLAWFAAVGLGGRFLERPGLLRALALGAAVGLAQNVKYNGWLAGAIVLLAALMGAAVDREARRPAALARTFGWGFVAAGLAALLYLPWFLFVENHGGYAALIRHHQSYTQGFSAWYRNWSQQLAQVAALSGWRLWGLLTWGVAWVAAGVAVCGRRLAAGTSRWDGARFRLGGLLLAAFFAAMPDLGWWAGLAWLPWLAIDRRPAVHVLAAWWLVLSVLTPLYHPYARLWLPLHGAGWVLLAGAVVALGPFAACPTTELPPTRAGVFTPRLVAQGAAVLLSMLLARGHWAWERREPGAIPVSSFFEGTAGIRTAVAGAMNTPVVKGPPRVTLRILGRRPIAFYAAMWNRALIRLVARPEDVAGGSLAPGELALLDEAVVSPSEFRRILPGRERSSLEGQAGWNTGLDPVTLLDVYPELVFREQVPRATAFIALIRPPGPGNAARPAEPPLRPAPRDLRP